MCHFFADEKKSRLDEFLDEFNCERPELRGFHEMAAYHMAECNSCYEFILELAKVRKESENIVFRLFQTRINLIGWIRDERKKRSKK